MVEGHRKVACKVRAEKVEKAGKKFDGVQDVKGDSSNNQLTVWGKVHPEKIRESIEKETKKKVVLLPSVTLKLKLAEKRTKEPVATTVVLKTSLRGGARNRDIEKIISKIKGVEHVSFDPQKDLVIVKGTMDAKTLLEDLKKKLNQAVEIVQPKK